MAPLDVVQSDSTVATDKQALISSQSNLNFQQLILKQAIARNLNDPALVAAPVIPTDRVSLDELPEERQTLEELVQIAFKNRPELEQASAFNQEGRNHAAGRATNAAADVRCLRLLRRTRHGRRHQSELRIFRHSVHPGPVERLHGYAWQSSQWQFAGQGHGLQLPVPIRNRTAQADQARSLMEYRQAEMHLEQLYTQIRMQVVNAQYALTNDRAQVRASIAAEDYAQQSLDAEQKKLQLGASTTANVLLQERNLATAENNLITANLTYAKDRALLYQMLATTLQHYGINLTDAATGKVGTAPVIPGLQPATDTTVAPTTPPSSK